MARLEGDTSNSLFDVFEEWETYFKTAKIDLSNLSESVEAQSDATNSPSLTRSAPSPTPPLSTSHKNNPSESSLTDEFSSDQSNAPSDPAPSRSLSRRLRCLCRERHRQRYMKLQTMSRGSRLTLMSRISWQYHLVHHTT